MAASLRAVLEAMLEIAAGLPPYVLLPSLFLICLSPYLLFLVISRVVWPRLRARSAARTYRRRNWSRAGILLLAAVIIAGVHLWSRTATPLLIYSEGPVPKAVQRIGYDLTVEPDGSLLVSEEMTLTLTRDPRALFRPLRRDQPVSDVSLIVDGRPAQARVWIGPQYGIRLGAGTPSGTHLYRLSYRLQGATRDGIYIPKRFSGPGFSICLTDVCTETPVQRVRWRPVTWAPGGEQVFTWRFPRPLTLAETGMLNSAYTWLADQPEQIDERTLQFRADLTSYTQTPEWLATLTVPEGMTSASVPKGSLTPSLPVVVIPVLALLGVIVARIRIGGRPRGRATLKAEYASPDGLSAAELGELLGAHRGVLAITALTDAVARGVLRVDALRCHRPLLPDQQDDEFAVTGSTGGLPQPVRRFVSGLTRGRDRIRTSQLEGRCWAEAEELEKDLHRSLTDAGYYSRHRELQRAFTWALALVLLAGGPYATFFLGNQFPWLLPVSGASGADVLRFTEAALLAWTLAAAVVALFATMIPTITVKGALARSRALGFAEYLRTAELGPVEHERREGYATHLLPYAVAFGLVPSLMERWHGLIVAPDDSEDRDRLRGSIGEPRFGDEPVERTRLLYPLEQAPTSVTRGGERG